MLGYKSVFYEARCFEYESRRIYSLFVTERVSGPKSADNSFYVPITGD